VRSVIHASVLPFASESVTNVARKSCMRICWRASELSNNLARLILASRKVARKVHEAPDVHGAILMNPIDVAMRRLDSSVGDAKHTDAGAEIFAKLANRRVLAQRQAPVHDEPRVAENLPSPKFSSCVSKCFVDVAINARMKPNGPHSTE